MHIHTRLTTLFPGLPGYQKDTTSLDFTETRDSEWHQLGGAICKSALHSRQTTTPAPHHSDFTGQMSFCCPTNSIKALMAKKITPQKSTENAVIF